MSVPTGCLNPCGSINEQCQSHYTLQHCICFAFTTVVPKTDQIHIISDLGVLANTHMTRAESSQLPNTHVQTVNKEGDLKPLNSNTVDALCTKLVL